MGSLSRVPQVNVVGQAVNIVLNSNAAATTRAGDVVAAVNAHPQAMQRVIAAKLSGDDTAAVGNRATDYSPLLPVGLGSSFDTASDLTNSTDSGAVLVVTAGGRSFVDGTYFEITNAGLTKKFEFDQDAPPSLNDPQVSIGVAFNVNMSQAQMTAALTAAINAAGLGVQAQQAGNRIHFLSGNPSVDLSSGVPGLRKEFQVSLDPSQGWQSGINGGVIISSAIEPQPFLLDFLGANNEPGHRDIPAAVGSGIQNHYNTDFADQGRDGTPGVTTILYNFRSDLTDATGNTLANGITEQQKALARQAFQLWGNYLGVQFVESAREGLTVATGDLGVLLPGTPNVLNFPSNSFRVRIDPAYANGLIVMDNTQQWSNDFGGDWFVNTMVGIGSMLGLDLANDLPASTLMARFTAPALPYLNQPDPEPIFPGNADILHGQFLYRMDSVDVDLYRFQIDLLPGREGIFTAETFAERLPNASLLDTSLSLYRENPDGSRELIARNDDYFSRDSFLELRLSAGIYYVGVSAGGNTAFDPTIDTTGLGGNSQGPYDLRLNFRSQVEAQNSIVDADLPATPLDGDADGVPGGVYDFWFQTRPQLRTLEITEGGDRYVDGQVLTITNNKGAVKRFEFDNQAGPNTVRPGNIEVEFGPLDTPETIAGKLKAAIDTADFGVVASVSRQTGSRWARSERSL